MGVRLKEAPLNADVGHRHNRWSGSPVMALAQAHKAAALQRLIIGVSHYRRSDSPAMVQA
jgi:hypothetical protein